jgi:hypothetical protein
VKALEGDASSLMSKGSMGPSCFICRKFYYYGLNLPPWFSFS